MDVICAYFTPKKLNFFDKFLIYFIKKISLVQSIIGATEIRGCNAEMADIIKNRRTLKLGRYNKVADYTCFPLKLTPCIRNTTRQHV